MLSPSLRRRTLVFLLAAAFTASWPAAAGPRPPAVPQAIPTAASLFARAWRLLANLWGAEGCYIDPDGRCLTGATPPPPNGHSDTGCYIDPNGRCIH